MLQSAEILRAAYPGEFTTTELLGYDKVIDLPVIEELARLYRQSGR
jgi:hypothetical protein